MTDRKLPPNASVAQAQEGDKMHAPAAARNAQAIIDLLSRIAPASGTALELASGTGQHVVQFAKALPHLTWQPTEVAADRLKSIAAYRAEAGIDTLLPPLPLNATSPGWGAKHAVDLIVLINLAHLIGVAELKTLLGEVGMALQPGGQFVLYGPFMRDGQLISDGDRSFHATLTASDPEIGYKNTVDVAAWMADEGLDLTESIEMPANNLALIAKRR